MVLSNILCIRDLERAAQGILSNTVLGTCNKVVSTPVALLKTKRLTLSYLIEYFNDGSEDGIAARENVSIFDEFKIRQRILRDVSHIDSSKKVLGSTMSFPLAVAPSGMQCMAHEKGEKATARAAAKAGVFMGVSTFATTSLEDIKRAGDEVRDNVYMLQLYIFKNRKTTEDLVRRAEGAGYRAVLLTCDTPKLGNRYNMTRNNFKLPSHLSLPNFGKQRVGPLIQHVVRQDDSTSGEDPNVNGK